MTKRIIFWLSVAFVLFHIITPFVGVIPGIGQRAIHLGLILVIYYLSCLFKKESNIFKRGIDSLLVLASASSIIYLMKIDSTIDMRSGIIYTEDIVFGIFLIVALIEATRRIVGNALAIITILFVIYGFAGPYMPGILSHPGLTLNRFINIVYLSSDGIFGVALYASAVYIVLFIILGAVFAETGVGDYFTNLATRFFGRLRGGPAKVAVVSSALFGSISGSAMANVISTGTFTIPLMKKSGFKTDYAAGIEASASTGGQIMPPIMGATAFLIAEIVGIPYFELVKAAFIPALLYFAAVLMTVDLYARRNGIQGIPLEDLPKLSNLVKQLYLLIPLVFLVILLGVFNSTIMRAGIWTIVVTLIVVMFNKKTRLNKEKLVKSVEGSINGATTVAIACAVVGIIIGVLMSSGLGFRISNIIIDVAGGNMAILLILTMVVSLILGMGLPTTAAYLVLAVLVAPAMIEMGVDPLAAHLFIFYFGIISNITPPVALASFTAAGVARSNPNKVAIQSFKISLSGYILPFMFVYNPVLLFEGTWYDILLALVTSLIGVYFLSASLEKYFVSWHLHWIERIMLFAAALLLIDPTILTDVIGLGICAIIVISKIIKSKNVITASS
ncbi:TRAP transporter permease [Lederbergia graminis]|uniref:TRAP transporter permease n=1 Tax=Lederbergia graminis TaxID=735518 RepID=A0ABW0LI45_9BACI